MLTVHQRPPIGGQWKRVTPAWRSFWPEPERDDFSRHNSLDGCSIAVRKGRRSRAVNLTAQHLAAPPNDLRAAPCGRLAGRPISKRARKRDGSGLFRVRPRPVSARQKGGFDLLSLHRKIPFPLAAENGSMTGWWVTSLCPITSTTQSSGIELRG
jgi:hypothetical protein